LTWRRVLAVLASAAAFAAAFPPYDLGWLAWIALVPLVLATLGVPPRTAFRLGYLWGLAAFGSVLWWLVSFGVGAWALGAGILALAPAVVVAVAAWADRGRPADVLWLPVLWTAAEFLRSQGPLAFPWALLGESQHATLVMAQAASAVGVFGLSFLVILANVALARLVARRVSAAGAVAAALALALTWAWGYAALHAPSVATGASRPLVAAVVQTTYSTLPGRAALDARARIDQLDVLTRRAARAGAQVVVWPETASPTDILGDPTVLNQFGGWAREGRITLVASSLEGGLSDSAFVFAPDGLLSGRYDKARLVPFAEFGERSETSPAVVPTLQGPLGIAICFESIFPDLARRSVVAGASLLAVQTNDQWFAGPMAASQHAAIASLRAIEEGRYVLRAANDGVSEIIDPRGRVLARLAAGTPGVVVAPVVAASGLTPYARIGDVVAWGALLASVVLLVPRAARELRGPADEPLARLLAVSFVPLAVLDIARWAVHAWFPGRATVLPLPIVATVASVAALSIGQPLGRVGLQLRGFVPAAVAALAVIGAMYWLALQGFGSHSAPVVLVPPPGGWWTGGAIAVLVVGLTVEWWLRGLVFEAASAWRGWRAAVCWSAALGVAAAVPLGAEAMVWALCVGVAFGCIRARWAQVPALALAHGVGVSLLGFLLSGW
jgi:apolipoprotein N-acyltransferase